VKRAEEELKSGKSLISDEEIADKSSCLPTEKWFKINLITWDGRPEMKGHLSFNIHTR